MGISAHGRRIMAALEDGRSARRHDGGWRVGVLDAPDSLIAELTRADLVDAAAGGLALTAAGRGFTARTARPEAANRLLVERMLPRDKERAGAQVEAGADEGARGRPVAAVKPTGQTGGGKRPSSSASRSAAAAPTRPARSVTVNIGESPLGWLMARGMISRRQYDAGERLRADWEMAGLSPRVTMRWNAAPVARGPRGADAPLDPTLAQIAAQRRFDAAIIAAGPGLADICWRVVCAGDGLEAAERALAWPKRAGKLVLLLALDRMADVYGLA